MHVSMPDRKGSFLIITALSSGCDFYRLHMSLNISLHFTNSFFFIGMAMNSLVNRRPHNHQSVGKQKSIPLFSS